MLLEAMITGKKLLFKGKLRHLFHSVSPQRLPGGLSRAFESAVDSQMHEGGGGRVGGVLVFRRSCALLFSLHQCRM